MYVAPGGQRLVPAFDREADPRVGNPSVDALVNVSLALPVSYQNNSPGSRWQRGLRGFLRKKGEGGDDDCGVGGGRCGG